jgi:hypothetical protein
LLGGTLNFSPMACCPFSSVRPVTVNWPLAISARIPAASRVNPRMNFEWHSRQVWFE